MEQYYKIRKLFEKLIDYEAGYLEIFEDINYIIYQGNKTYIQTFSTLELFKILLHEYIYQFLEKYQVDEIEDLPEEVKSNFLKEIESLKKEYKSITKSEYIEICKNDFGEILKNIRQYRKLTKAQLSRNICDIRTISRIENGDIDCPTDLLDHFSEELHFDFRDFQNEIYYCKTLNAYFVVKEFFDAISNYDIIAVKNIILKMENLKEFSTGHNLQMLYYAKALVAIEMDKEIEQSKNYCLKGIAADGKIFDLNNLSIENYTHMEQILIHTYAYNLKIQGKYEQAKKIFSFILSILDDYPKTKYKHYYKYAEKEKSLYMSCIQNLSAIAYLECHYTLGLSYTQKGFEFICQHNVTFYIPILLQKEFCHLCRLKRYEEAIKTYNISLYIAERMKNEALVKSLQADYQELIIDTKELE